MLTKVKQPFTAWKVSINGVFSGPNTGKYGPEKTTYLDTFHAVGEAETAVKRLKLDNQNYVIARDLLSKPFGNNDSEKYRNFT